MSVRSARSVVPVLRSFGADAPAAGWASVVTVALAGLTLGFFAWYGAIVPLHHPFLSNASMLLLALMGGVAAIAAWEYYARYFSRRTGIKLERSLKYDALSWAMLLVLWLSFILPISITHSGRMLVLGIGLFCLTKLLIAARFNQTVREVLIDFAVTRVAILVIAELAAVTIGQRAGHHVAES
ncbi:MAG: hypothetical protein JOZ38_01730, partial [Candidatus Eremiobacteraeota bacterium]|nr:hypothetical protein [Candidatus Eremiobacteraeota bacterium]